MGYIDTNSYTAILKFASIGSAGNVSWDDEITSIEHSISSISITYGCYDGNVVGDGAVYYPSVSISMEPHEKIRAGQYVKMQFAENKTGMTKVENFGIYKISNNPTTSTSGEISVNLISYVEGIDSADLVTASYNQETSLTITVQELLSKIKSAETELGFGFSSGELNFDFSKISEEILESFKSTEIIIPKKQAEGGEIKVSQTLREIFSGLSIILGGNCVILGNTVYFYPKQTDYYNKDKSDITFDKEQYNSYDLSKETYGINKIYVSYIDVEAYTADGTFEYIKYSSDGERKKALVLDSAVPEGDLADTEYTQTIECDWVTGYKAFLSAGAPFLFGSLVQGDLVYHIGSIEITGKTKIVPGCLVNLKTVDEEDIRLYAGEVTEKWDGGFLTEVSCSCNIDTATGSATSSISSSGIAGGGGNHAGGNVSGDYATKSEFNDHVNDKQIHVNVEKVGKDEYSYRIGTSGTQSGVGSLVAAGEDNTASGDFSVAEGKETKAEGYASHSEGQESVSRGAYSHGEGLQSETTGTASHAENKSKATGNFSHSEGSSESKGDVSHAEGLNTKARGKSSHSEGSASIANREGSHSEGVETIAGTVIKENEESDENNVAQHAEGIGTLATGYAAHGEGKSSKATGHYSHAENSSTASGEKSHSEGESTASGNSSHAENGSTAYGKYSHSEGSSVAGKQKNETDSNSFQHSEGKETEATGLAGHSEGEETTASGEASHSEGYKTKAEKQGGHSEGGFTKANGRFSHAENYSSTSDGEGSHAENNSQANGKYSHSEGSSFAGIKNNESEENSFQHSEGITTTATGQASHSEGIETTASGKASHSEGGKVGISGGGTNESSGKASHSEGSGTKAKGDASHSEGIGTFAGRENTDMSAGNKYAQHAEGVDTKATGHGSHAEGNGSKSSGEAGHSEGKTTLASGVASHSEGKNTTASGEASHSEGEGTLASSANQHAQGKYNVAGANYAHIVGGGESDTKRKNIHTLTWAGRAWFSGDVENGDGVTMNGLKQAIDEIEGGKESSVTGVKGEKESSYRTGNVNLTPDDIGALPLDGTAENANKLGGIDADLFFCGRRTFNGNVNDIVNNGVYWCNSATGIPVSAQYGLLIAENSSAPGVSHQIYIPYIGDGLMGATYERMMVNGVWSEWTLTAIKGGVKNFLGNNTGFIRPNHLIAGGSANVNDYTKEWHGFVYNMTNLPSGETYGFLDVTWFNGNGFTPSPPENGGVVRQIFTSWSSGKIYTRTRVNNSWGAWKGFVYSGIKNSSTEFSSVTAQTVYLNGSSVSSAIIFNDEGTMIERPADSAILQFSANHGLVFLSNIRSDVSPTDSNTYTLGTSAARWKEIWCATSLNTSSDRNLKKDIKDLADDDRYIKFFMMLQPKSYLFKDGESGRTHVGFISQDVEDAMKECGLSDLEFAGFCKDQKKKRIPKMQEIVHPADEENEEEWIEEVDFDEELVFDEDGNPVYEYSLRYEEFIALNTMMIQKQQDKLSEMEDRLGKLEKLVLN